MNRKKILERLWNHPNKFQGIKCKTCLPLDDVEDIINQELGE